MTPTSGQLTQDTNTASAQTSMSSPPNLPPPPQPPPAVIVDASTSPSPPNSTENVPLLPTALVGFLAIASIAVVNNEGRQFIFNNLTAFAIGASLLVAADWGAPVAWRRGF